VAITLYTGPGAGTDASESTLSAVFVFAGNTMQQVGHINGMELRYTSTYSISGTTISTADTCPEPDSSSHAPSATPSGIRIYDTESAGTVEQTLHKR
jgi:hypothetical protein